MAAPVASHASSPRWPMRPLVAATAAATVLKLLLLPSYHSTDFEVHRNWMATTASLPIERWYLDETSQWTLDYPPLFAWFEWLLSFGARLTEPDMLRLSSDPYFSPATLAYQRLTVIATDALLILGALAFITAHCHTDARGRGGGVMDGSDSLDRAKPADAAASAASLWATHFCAVLVPFALAVCNAGLLLVDHMHFQYNGMLIGLLLLALASIRRGHDLRAAFFFAVLLNLKHLFLFAAPVFFLQLLRHHVLRHPSDATPSPSDALRRFFVLAATVLAVLGASFGPFVAIGQLPQLLSRLFPFGRGLTHAYWAPNTWALYTALDRVLAAGARRLGARGIPAASEAATRGLVGDTVFAVMPAVRPAHTAALVVLLQAPVLWRTWREPKRATAFAPAVAYCGLAAFLVGWHVHEKAALPPLLIICCLAPTEAQGARLHARLLLLLGASAQYALLPLIFGPREYAVSRFLVLTYTLVSLLCLDVRCAHICGEGGDASSTHTKRKSERAAGFVLAPLERLYLWGFLPLEFAVAWLHPLLLADRLPFLPLLCTSVYCALGVHYCLWLTYRLWALQYVAGLSRPTAARKNL